MRFIRARKAHRCWDGYGGPRIGVSSLQPEDRQAALPAIAVAEGEAEGHAAVVEAVDRRRRGGAGDLAHRPRIDVEPERREREDMRAVAEHPFEAGVDAQPHRGISA